MDQGITKGIAQGITQGITQGIAQGHEEERLNSIRSLMETLNLTLDQAMQALKIPGSEREKLLTDVRTTRRSAKGTILLIFLLHDG